MQLRIVHRLCYLLCLLLAVTVRGQRAPAGVPLGERFDVTGDGIADIRIGTVRRCSAIAIPSEFRDVASASIRSFLHGTGWFTASELEELLARFAPRAVRRKEHVLHAGELCKAVLYVEQGCFRAYTTGRDLKDSVLWFATEDWWLSDLDSLFHRTPASFDIQALEDGTVQAIPRDAFLDALERYPKFKEGHVQKVRGSHQAMLQRLTALRLLNADERYASLLRERPEVVQRVPLQHIASYLDLEPQTLSKVRARLAR